MVKNHLWVFLNCYVENPAFDSQVRPAPLGVEASGHLALPPSRLPLWPRVYISSLRSPLTDMSFKPSRILSLHAHRPRRR
mgnify:CR=1 FL=1